MTMGWDTILKLPVVRRYLEAVREQHRYIDARGVMQVVREVKLAIDDAFVGMRVRIERPSDRFPTFVLLPTADPAGPVIEAMPDLRLAALAGSGERAGQASVIPADGLLRRGTRWFVLGDPGGGKTTLLRRMAYQAATSALDGSANPARMPLFLPLRHLVAGAGRTSIVDHFCGAGLDDLIEVTSDERAAWREALLAALTGGHGVLLCDGLDEQRDAAARHASGQAVNALLKSSGRVPCVITSRVVGFDAGTLRNSFQVAHLLPFDERQTEEFFDKWMLAVERADDLGDASVVTGRAQRRTRQLITQLRANPGVLALASNPLMCAIVGLIFRQGAVLPELRGELYKLCVDTFVFNWEINKRRAGEGAPQLRADETQAVLEAVALDFQERPRGNAATREELLALTGSFVAQEFGLSPGEARQRADRLLDLVVDVAGLLIERSPGHFGFFHLTLQEYLAGRAITRRRGETAGHVARHWLDPRWREVLRLAAAHQGGKGREEGEQFIELLLVQTHPHDPVMHYSLRLAIECAGDIRVGPRLADRLLLTWDQAWRERPAVRDALRRSLAVARGAIRASAETLIRMATGWFRSASIKSSDACLIAIALADTRLVDELLLAIPKLDSAEKLLAIHALSVLEDPRVGDTLLALCNDEKWSTRLISSAYFARSGDPRALATLTNAVRGKDEVMSLIAAGALGDMADAGALDALVALARGEARVLREAGMRGLGRSAHPVAFEALQIGLRDPDGGVRAAAVEAISTFTDERVWDALLSSMSDKDERVRKAAALALAKLVDPRAYEPLLTAIDDGSTGVRVEAIKGLGKLADQRAREALANCMTDAEENVRHAAAQVMGTLGDVRALSQLLTVLSGDDSTMRQEAALALGYLNEPQALDALIAGVGDRDESVRRVVVQALGMRVEARALDALLYAVRDEDGLVRVNAGTALAEGEWLLVLSESQVSDLLRLAENAEGGEGAAQVVEAFDRREFVKANP